MAVPIINLPNFWKVEHIPLLPNNYCFFLHKFFLYHEKNLTDCDCYRLDFPVRSGPGIPGLQQYEEYEFDRSCQYSACRCRTLPHPDYADVYFEERNCTSGSGRLVKACPNGLVYTGNGRNGLVSVCDYPHRASWSFGRERHSKSCHFPPFCCCSEWADHRAARPLQNQDQGHWRRPVLRQVLGVRGPGASAL